MLDVLRKHASSWLIKAILGAIVISFIFFFGYNASRKSSRSGRGGNADAVGSVNGAPIPAAEYQFFLDRTFERMRASFEGKEVPEFVRKMAQSTTFQQLVARELSQQLADSLGILIPNEQLADAIRQTPGAQRGGEFDPIFYKHEFLPYFQNRFGINFENLVLQDLRAAAVESTFQDVDRNPQAKPDEAAAPAGTWTFEVVTLDPKALAEAKVIGKPEEARQAAEMLSTADPRNWKGMLATLKLSPRKVGPISMRERASIFEGQGTYEDYTKVFALTRESPVMGAPLERSGKLYVVRLVDAVKAPKATPSPWPPFDFYRAWMAKLADKAKIHDYLRQEQEPKQ